MNSLKFRFEVIMNFAGRLKTGYTTFKTEKKYRLMDTTKRWRVSGSNLVQTITSIAVKFRGTSIVACLAVAEAIAQSQPGVEILITAS
jgi:hypothetical protein